MQRIKHCFHFTVTVENNVFMCVTIERAIYFNPYSQMGFHVLYALNKTATKMKLSSVPRGGIPAGKASTEKYTYKYRWPSPPVPTVIVRNCCLKHDDIELLQGKLVAWWCLRTVLTVEPLPVASSLGFGYIGLPRSSA